MTDKMILLQIPAFCLQQSMNIKAPQKQSMVSPIYTASLQLKSLLGYICTLKSLKQQAHQEPNVLQPEWRTQARRFVSPACMLYSDVPTMWM